MVILYSVNMGTTLRFALTEKKPLGSIKFIDRIRYGKLHFSNGKDSQLKNS